MQEVPLVRLRAYLLVLTGTDVKQILPAVWRDHGREELTFQEANRADLIASIIANVFQQMDADRKVESICPSKGSSFAEH